MIALVGVIAPSSLRGGGPSDARADPTPAPRAVDARASSAPTKDAWASDTWSPRPGALNDPRDAAIAALCGGGIDAALVRVAGELAESLATRGELPDAQEIEWRQRKAGNPHVWARSWGAHLAGGVLDRKALAAQVTGWLGSSAPQLRCGVASYRVASAKGLTDASRDAVALIAVDPVADLGALPTRTRVGAWLDVDVTLWRGGSGGRVVVVPPTGAPRTVLSTTVPASGGAPAHIKARVLVGSPGRHVLQVLADDLSGPRPVVEAEVWAGVEPPTAPPSSAVPGEEAGEGVAPASMALLRRLNGVRKSDGLPPLAWDDRLATVARAHATAMLRAHALGHDVGDGGPRARIDATGIAWQVLGENVGRARTELGAHRALYASPSHRGNMLDRRFMKVGIGAVVDAGSGEVWVAQEFGG